MFGINIMEKGDKPKADKPKAKAKAKAKQTQKQSQKQSVKIVIGEKAKPKRKYVRKPKVAVPTVNIVRGQTAVSYLGADGDLNQVISIPQAKQPVIQQTLAKPPTPPPQPPVLSSTQAPTTLDSELTAVSELSMPKARTPAFSEVQEEVPKKKTKAKAKSTLFKIGEGIGDFIKQNLLDQPADLKLQEPSRAVEKPRPPLVIQPESKPMKPGKAKAEDIYKKVEKPVKGKTDVPVEIFVAEPKGKELPSTSELVMKEQTGAEEVKENTQTQLIKEKAKKIREKKTKDIVEEPVEKLSLQDEAPITKEERNESLRRMIVEDTVDDIISTIETPIFSTNPDFKTISQNVDIENVPSSQLDFGNEDLTQFNVDNFVPVGRTEGFEETSQVLAQESKSPRGRPKKYGSEEEARQMKIEQTKESNRRIAEEKKNAKKWESITKKLIEKEQRATVDKEWEEFNALDQATDSLRSYIETKKEQKRYFEESPYTYERQFPNAPQIQVAQDYSPFGEYAGSVLIYDVGRKIAEKKNREAYDSDFISGDFQQQIGDLLSTNNFSIRKPMIGESDIGYADENPVLTTATFSKDAVDSNLPFLGLNDIQFL